MVIRRVSGYNPSMTAGFIRTRWYALLKFLHVLLVILFGLVLVIVYATVFNDGRDGISIALKIASVPILAGLAWLVANTPRRIFEWLTEKEGSGRAGRKIQLILGLAASSITAIALLALLYPGANSQALSPSAAVDAAAASGTSAGSAAFVRAFAGLTGSSVEQGGPVKLIENGADFLQILLSSMDAASSSIDFTTFPWADGAMSDQVFASLIRAAKRGVVVRLLLDSFGSHSLSRSAVDELRSAGGTVREYHPFDILDPMRYDSRDHVRSIVIDGKTAFTGGMGITSEWYGSPPNQTFADMMFEVTGAMAADIQDSFVELWAEASGEALSGPALYPSPLSATVARGNAATTNSFAAFTSFPATDREPVRDAFLLTALSARKKLYIAGSYIVPDRGLLDALENRARAGVDVRIVSPGPATVAPLLRDAWHADYAELLAAGVKLYEYQPSMIHTKFVVADDIWSLIGSANVDNRSEAINIENLMGVSDPSLASQLYTVFMGYVSRSKEVTLSDWQRQYGFFQRLYSRLLLVLYKQF